MYSRQYKTRKTSAKSSDTPVSNQFAPRPFVVQPQPQTPDLQTQQEKAEQSSNSFANISTFRPGYQPPSPPRIQMKLTIGQPGDKYEQEADRVAAGVVQRINSPQISQIQRLDAPEEDKLQMKPFAGTIQRQEQPEAEDKLQMKPIVQRLSVARGMAATPDLEKSIQGMKGNGQPLAENIRQPMEQAFGTDFSRVKIHSDSQSDQLNQSIQAKAFTTGQDIFFRQGEYAPGTRGGQELIAHELTHTLQQTGTTPLHSSSQSDKEQSSTSSYSPIPLSAAPSNLISRDPIAEAATAKTQAGEAINHLNTALTKANSVASVATEALKVIGSTTQKIRQQATNAKQIADEVTDLQQQVTTAAQAARDAANKAQAETVVDFDPAANTNEVSNAKVAIDANADAKIAEVTQIAITALADTVTTIADTLNQYATAKETLDIATTDNTSSAATLKEKQQALSIAQKKVKEAEQAFDKATASIKQAEEQVTKAETGISQARQDLATLKEEGKAKEVTKQDTQNAYDLAKQNLAATEEVILQANKTIETLEIIAIPEAQLTVERQQAEADKLKIVVTENEATANTATEESVTAQAEATSHTQTAQTAQTIAEQAAQRAAEVSAYIAKLTQEMTKIEFTDDLADHLAGAEYVIGKAALEAAKAANLAKTATDSQKKANAAQEAAEKAQEAVEQAIEAVNLAEENLLQAKAQVTELESKNATAKVDKEAAQKQIPVLKKAVIATEQAAKTAASAVTKAQNAITSKEQQLTKAKKTLTEKEDILNKRLPEAENKKNDSAQAITNQIEANQLVTEATQKAAVAAQALETAKTAAKQVLTQVTTAKTKVEGSTKTGQETYKDLVTATTPNKKIEDIKNQDIKKIKQEQLLLKGVGGQANLTELTTKEASLDKLVTMFEAMGYPLLKECLVTKAIATDFLVNMAKQADFQKAITDLITAGRANADIATVFEKAKKRGQTLVPYADLSKLLKQAHTIPTVNLTHLAFWISKKGGQKASELHTYIDERKADLTQIWTGTTCAMPAITPPPANIRVGDDLNYIIANAVAMTPPGSIPPNWGYAGNRPWGTVVRPDDGVTPRYNAAGGAITYKEYDITYYQTTPGYIRDGNRIIIGSDGRQYYTSDHYKHFSKIV